MVRHWLLNAHGRACDGCRDAVEIVSVETFGASEKIGKPVPNPVFYRLKRHPSGVENWSWSKR